jgi:PAS domain S-box-containing protein
VLPECLQVGAICRYPNSPRVLVALLSGRRSLLCPAESGASAVMSASGTSRPHIGRAERYLRSWRGPAAVTVVAAAALIFDVSTPQVVSVSPGYVGLVLVGYWLPDSRAAFALALLATPLIIFGHWISIPESTPEWESWVNRAFSIGDVWLTGAFVWLVRSLEQKLRWLASIVECSGDAIASTNLDGITISWNMSAERMFGYGSEEVIGTPITILVPPEHQHERDFILERIRRGDCTEHFETICRRRDGHLVDVSMTISSMRDVHGKVVGASRIARDITQRKEREERERLLMGEINHRGKNLLSVVDAIARQTATRDPEHFVDYFSQRIQALSANQDLLTKNAWHGVEIEDLVRAQLALFADLIGSRIAVCGPKLRLNAAAAQAIGLALHELSTNAGKYGALCDTGLVDVCWGTEGNTFTVSWTERNGPPVSPPLRRGFGTVVMKEMAERSVDGAVDLNYAASGLTWRLACSAANALESQS